MLPQLGVAGHQASLQAGHQRPQQGPEAAFPGPGGDGEEEGLGQGGRPEEEGQPREGHRRQGDAGGLLFLLQEGEQGAQEAGELEGGELGEHRPGGHGQGVEDQPGGVK